jgi:single-strand DNA-binding protein
MSGTVNRVILIGRLGKDPQVRFTQEGTAVANFSVATDESFTDRAGDKQTRTEWHSIVAWKRLAEISGEYLSKGRAAYIEGSLRTRKWTDQQGNEHTKVEIVASRIVLLGSKNGSQQNSNGSSPNRMPSEQPQPPAPEVEDDIPF